MSDMDAEEEEEEEDDELMPVEHKEGLVLAGNVAAGR
jgi:hypothetical protein